MTDITRTTEELGRETKERRLKKGLSIPDIAGNTKIRIPFLEAIENGRLSELPQELYARGFVRRYLETLDSMDLWPEYEKQFASLSQDKETGSLVQYMPTQKGFQKVSKAWIFAFLLVAIGFSLYLIWQQRDVMSQQAGTVAMIEEITVPPVVEAESVPEEAATVASGQDRSIEEEAEAETAEATPVVEGADTSWIPGHAGEPLAQEMPARAGRLVIRASGPCWIGVSRDDGGRVQRTLSRGDTFETDVDVRTTVRFGSAGAVSLSWGEDEIGTIGRMGEVVTYEFLPDGSMKRL